MQHDNGGGQPQASATNCPSPALWLMFIGFAINALLHAVPSLILRKP